MNLWLEVMAEFAAISERPLNVPSVGQWDGSAGERTCHQA